MHRSSYGYRSILASSIATLIVSTCPLAHSATLTWDADSATAGVQDGTGTWNTTNNNWQNAGSNVSWVNNTPADDAVFGTGSGTGAAIALGANITAASLTFNTTGYSINGAPNTLTLSGASTIFTGTGVTTTISANLATASGITKTGVGTLLLTGSNGGLAGGAIVNAGTLAVDGDQSAAVLPNNALVTINNGGTFEIRGVNALPTAGNSCDVTLEVGGILRVLTGGSGETGAGGESHGHLRNLTLNGGTIELGYSGAGAAYDGESFQLNGGITVGGSAASTINVINGATTGQQGISLAGERTLNVADVTGNSAGDLIVNAELENTDGGNGSLAKAGVGTLVLAANNSYSNGTTINEGVIQVGNGGNAGSLGSGGVTNNATLDFKFSNGTVANAISGTGLVRQVGTGSTTLTADSTYTGATQVKAGKLFVNGSIGVDSAVSVDAGATLAGKGSVNGTVAVSHNGQIASGDSLGVGTLTIGSLTLGTTSGDLMAFNLTPVSGTPSILIANTDGLIANGGNNSASINILSLPAGLGTYTLIDYNGTLGGGGFAALKLATLPPRVVGSLVNNTGATSIDLSITGTDFPIWTGASSSAWSTATLSNPKNWVLNSNSAPTDYLANDNVVFNDNATTTTVDISSGDVSPATVTFNNSTKNYTITGTNGIAGSTGLTKTGTGTLTINTTNSFTGAVELKAGTVSIPGLTNSGSPSPLGTTASIVLGDASTGVTLQISGTTSATNRTFTINDGGATFDISDAAGSHTLGGVVSGTGGLTKAGPGTLILNQLNTYAGETVVNGGVLQLSTAGGFTGIIKGTLTINPGATVRATSGNALGYGDGVRVTTLNVNGGLFDTTAAGDQGWGIAINLTGGVLQSNNGVSDAASTQRFALGAGSAINSLASATTSVVSGRVNVRENNPGDVLPFNVEDGAAETDLLVSAAITGGAPRGISKAGPGKMVLSGNNTYGGPTNIDAGILQVGNGGTTGTLGNGTGAVTNNGTLVLNRTGVAPLANAISGTGGVQQIGAGSVILSGALDYSGPTQITAGKLFINGTLANSTVSVASGGTFGGKGTISGAVTISTGGAIESGDGFGLGTLTLGTLTLSSGSTLNIYALSGANSLTITAADGLVANGASTINVIGAAPAIGTYTLVDYAGTLGGGFGNFSLGTLPPRVIGNLVNNTANTSIDLNVTGTDLPVWSGLAGGVWTTALQGNPKNWVLNSNGATATDFIANDTVVFNDSAQGTTTVNLSDVDVTPITTIFNNSTRNYTITGTKGIIGTGGLTKSGTGTVTIETTNSFTGPVVINSGVVSVPTVGNTATPSALGMGTSLTLGGTGTNGTLRFTGTTETTNRPFTLSGGGGTIDVPTGGMLTTSGTLSGAGSFTKSGAGTLVLSNNTSTLAGDVFINGGTVTVPVGTGSGSATSALGAKTNTRTITVNDAATLRMTTNNVFGGGGMTESQIPALTINPGGTVTSTQFNTIGTVNLNGGTLTQASQDTSGAYQGYQFIGTFNVGGTVPSTISAIADATNGNNARANHLLGGGSTTFNVNDVTLSSAADLIVSARLADGSGDYSGVAGLIKDALGTMVITSNCSYTGSTVVNAGKLIVNGSISGSQTLVKGGASLGGSGSFGAITLEDNATFTPGVSVGTLTTASLNLGAGSKLELELGAPGIVGGTENDLITITGGLTLDGVLHVVQNANFGDGIYRLVNYQGSFTDSILDLEPSFLLAHPGSYIDTATIGQVNLVVIPEPGVAMALLGGLGVLVGLRRKRS